MTGLLNSKLIDFIYKNYFSEKQKFPRILLENLKDICIPNISLSVQQPIIDIVNKIIELKQKERVEKDEHTKTMISRQIEGLDKAIDKAVYELYGLTEDDIKTVEDNN